MSDHYDPSQPRDDHGRWGSGSGIKDDGHTVDSLARLSLKSKLTPDEASALKQYSMRSSPVNSSLRKNISLHLNPNVARQISLMDSSFNKAALPDERPFYRVINKKYFDEALASNIGKEIVDKGFMSTTMNVETAKNVLDWLSSQELAPGASEPRFKMLQLIVPKNYPAIPMTSDTSAMVEDDNEVLLKRGTRFKLLDRRTVKVLT